MKISLFIDRESVAIYTDDGRFIKNFIGRLCEEKAKRWAELHGHDISNILRRVDSK